jgi:hypothetical protein
VGEHGGADDRAGSARRLHRRTSPLGHPPQSRHSPRHVGHRARGRRRGGVHAHRRRRPGRRGVGGSTAAGRAVRRKLRHRDERREVRREQRAVDPDRGGDRRRHDPRHPPDPGDAAPARRPRDVTAAPGSHPVPGADDDRRSSLGRLRTGPPDPLCTAPARARRGVRVLRRRSAAALRDPRRGDRTTGPRLRPGEALRPPRHRYPTGRAVQAGPRPARAHRGGHGQDRQADAGRGRVGRTAPRSARQAAPRAPTRTATSGG